MMRILLSLLVTAAALFATLPTLAGSNPSQLALSLRHSILAQVQADDIELFGLYYSKISPVMNAQDLLAKDYSNYKKEVHSLVLDLRAEKFNANMTLHPLTANQDTVTFSVSGNYQKLVSLPTLDRTVQRGDAIMLDSVAYSLTPERQVRGHHITDMQQLVGKVATRRLNAYHAISERDIKRPNIIVKGDKIHAIYRSSAMKLSALVEALEHGAIGDSITARNEHSGAIIKATITKNGELIVNSHPTPRNHTLASNR